MNRLSNFIILSILMGLYLIPFDANGQIPSRYQRYQNQGAQPRLYINQGLYPGYDQIYYNGASVRGNTIIQPVYNLPPATEPLRSPNSPKGRLTIDHLPPRK